MKLTGLFLTYVGIVMFLLAVLPSDNLLLRTLGLAFALAGVYVWTMSTNEKDKS